MWPLQEAQRQIDHGEKLIWAERAGAAKVAFRHLPTALFGIPFLAFSIFWTVMASSMTSGESGMFGLFPLFGLLFVAVGAGLVLSPFWGYAVGVGTVYAITDQRLMVLRKFPRYSVESYEPEDIGRITRTEGSGGRGDVIFREEMRRGSRGRTRTHRIGFFGVPHVRRVEDEVRKLKSKSRSRERND